MAEILKVVKDTKILQKSSSIIKKEIILTTEYGRLSVLNPVLTSQFKKDNRDSIIFRDINYLDNNSSVKKTKVIMSRQKDFFLFKPETNYYNSHLFYNSIRKLIFSDFYGDKKKSNNPFEKCKTAKEIFDLSRNIKMNVKKELSRFGFKLYKTGEIDIKFGDKSYLKDNVMLQDTLKQLIVKYENDLNELVSIKESDSKFQKHDYFISYPSLEGAVSSMSYSQKGIIIKALQNKRIFPLFGVFSPTRDDYIELFNSYLNENYKDVKHLNKALDIGCGSGVLSFIMAQFGINKVIALDKDKNAVISCKTNAEALGFHNKITAFQYDIVKETDENSKINGNEYINNNFGELDLIVCNPPWLNASIQFSQNEFENAIYDPSHKFLESSINYASKCFIY
jgi:16S rRNA G966 N2-methylase RsmD